MNPDTEELALGFIRCRNRDIGTLSAETKGPCIANTRRQYEFD
ncbi:MAG: hypothetical protein QOF48_146 [Verrucomicrobiota bacterium]